MAMLACCATNDKQLKCGDGWNGRYGGRGVVVCGCSEYLDFGYKEVE